MAGELKMDVREKLMELKHLKRVCEIQKKYIYGNIDKETYKKQMEDAELVYILYLQETSESLKFQKTQMKMVEDFMKKLTTGNEGDEQK